MLNITLNAGQLNKILKDVEKYRAVLEQPSGKKKFFMKISNIIRLAFREQFDTRGRAFGTPWPSLASSTILAKKYAGFQTGILRRTDKYYKALTANKSPDRILELTNQGLKYGINIDNFRDDWGLAYPAIHEMGTDEIPARPVFTALRESKKFKNMLIDDLIKWLSREMKKAGGSQ